jgi:dTDP-4-amino-4,6-dideoxygalactose transaminase
MTIPFAAPNRLPPDEAAAIRAALDSVLGSDRWILGPAVTDFEGAFATFLDRDLTGDHVVGVGNGTDALAIALLALGLSPGAEVLVAENEGGYAATAARLAGLVPRVMDVDARGHPVVSTAEDAVTDEVRAIVVTHLHGDAVPVDGLDAWRRERGLVLIEDCAQAHGLRVDGRHVGLTGDAATFSFYPTKNLGAVGDAGAIVLPDEGAAERARRLRQYGWGERYRVVEPAGRNSRLDPLQAAVLSARLPFLEASNRRRREISRRYREFLPLLGDPHATVAHHAVAVTSDRDELARYLALRGIDSAVHYPWLVSEMPGLAAAGRRGTTADAHRNQILSLPCFPTMTDVELDEVCAALAEWVGR